MRIFIICLLVTAAYAQQYDYIRQVANKPAVDVREYSWYRTSGSGATADLSATGSKTITVTPCPRALSASDYYFRIYDGTGTAEAVLRTGGTCTSNAATGTLVGTTVHTHTGSWKVGSASSGILEAVRAVEAIGSGRVQIPDGTYMVYAPITVVGSYIKIEGSGKGSTRLVTSGFSTEDVISFDGPGTQGSNEIHELDLVCSSAQTDGFGIEAVDQTYFKASRIAMTDCPGGVKIDDVNQGSLADLSIRELEPVTGVAVSIEGTTTFAMRIDRIVTDSGGASPFAGIRIRESGDVQITASHFLNSGFGMLIDPGAGQTVASVDVWGSFFDTTQNHTLTILPSTGGSVVRSRFVQCWFGSSATGNGVYIDSGAGGTVDGITFDSAQIYLNAQHGMLVSGSGVSNIRVSNSVISNNSVSSPGTYHGAFFNISDWQFTSNRSGPADGLSGTQSYGLAVFANTNTNYVITGNDLTGNTTAAMSDGGTGTVKTVRDNLGVDTAYATIVAAATIALPQSGESSAFITGNAAAITTILGGYDGREIVLVFTHATPAGLTASADIAVTVAPTQNVPVRCRRINSQWYCK